MRNLAIAIAAAALLGFAAPASAAGPAPASKYVQLETQNAAATEFSSRHRRSHRRHHWRGHRGWGWHRPVRVCRTIWTWRGPVQRCHWRRR